ncbi:hypothetical protein BHE74_00030851 [Ensete ventricosum]|nr:hypothetical protein BHE74_00030851 [Ensete ventricosum]RZS02529.1 hypothetical protein BHM03_00032589 [Ensete ventricosum]
MTKAKGEGSGDMKQGIGGCARVEQWLRRDSDSQRVAMAVGGGISKAEGVEGRGGTATTDGVAAGKRQALQMKGGGWWLGNGYSRGGRRWLAEAVLR